MKLYKYKSLSNFEFVVDILLNKRLYAAHFEDLNDPMEGDFDKNYADRAYLESIMEEMDSIRVCSLSKNMHNSILWAHYADGFKGICIEIEIDESILTPHEITYSGFTPIPSEGDRGVYGTEDEMHPYDWAIASLKGKYDAWKYEDEYRIFSQDAYIKNGVNITAIYLGTRIEDMHMDLIHKLCSDDIEIKKTIILESTVIPVVEFDHPNSSV